MLASGIAYQCKVQQRDVAQGIYCRSRICAEIYARYQQVQSLPIDPEKPRAGFP
jgi:hypothetical protein